MSHPMAGIASQAVKAAEAARKSGDRGWIDRVAEEVGVPRATMNRFLDLEAHLKRGDSRATKLFQYVDEVAITPSSALKAIRDETTLASMHTLSIRAVRDRAYAEGVPRPAPGSSAVIDGHATPDLNMIVRIADAADSGDGHACRVAELIDRGEVPLRGGYYAWKRGVKGVFPQEAQVNDRPALRTRGRVSLSRITDQLFVLDGQLEGLRELTQGADTSSGSANELAGIIRRLAESGRSLTAMSQELAERSQST